MNYCSNCRRLTENAVCPHCGATNLGEVQPKDYCLVTEKDEMWAKMFEQVLTDNAISCTSLPVYGAAMALRGGTVERWRIYVMYQDLERATELLKEAFPED